MARGGSGKEGRNAQGSIIVEEALEVRNEIEDIRNMQGRGRRKYWGGRVI